LARDCCESRTRAGMADEESGQLRPPPCRRRRPTNSLIGGTKSQRQWVDRGTWYLSVARIDQKRPATGGMALIAVQVAGIVAAGSKMPGRIDFDLAGVVAGPERGRCCSTWSAAAQRMRPPTPSPAGSWRRELEALDCNAADAERTWVAGVEEATSRERIMWRESRSQPE
jgi:hypothetical protein